jgi:hypothetical protein
MIHSEFLGKRLIEYSPVNLPLKPNPTSLTTTHSDPHMILKLPHRHKTLRNPKQLPQSLSLIPHRTHGLERHEPTLLTIHLHELRPERIALPYKLRLQHSEPERYGVGADVGEVGDGVGQDAGRGVTAQGRVRGQGADCGVAG